MKSRAASVNKKSDKLPSITKTKFPPQSRNWKKRSEREISKMSAVQRGRYLAYEAPPDYEAMRRSQARVNKYISANTTPQLSTTRDEQFTKRTGPSSSQGAWEASCRIRDLHTAVRMQRAIDVGHLVSQQDCALKALRVESLLPPLTSHAAHTKKRLGEKERRRIEQLVDDENGELTSRILSAV